ncbi:UNVERIFIED_CONTAM: putative late blight resistance proteinR1B-13 [Sesamum latifolium]|uniref:Late blight resistance proteinR1B-13 n=1 Tax=Sesamum latifolium TaxID=2727402 RepID=A0AAW2TFX8_9LAMI
MTTVGSLQNLEVMKLTSCSFEGCKWETTEGEFPRLKFLKIRRTNLQHWVTDSCHFPSLEHLQLFSCKRLGEIPDVLGEIPTLQIIEVNRSDRSLVKSAKQIKEEQQSFGNDSLQGQFSWGASPRPALGRGEAPRPAGGRGDVPRPVLGRGTLPRPVLPGRGALPRLEVIRVVPWRPSSPFASGGNIDSQDEVFEAIRNLPESHSDFLEILMDSDSSQEIIASPIHIQSDDLESS